MFPKLQKVERDIIVQGKVKMKVILPKEDKDKRLLLLNDAQVPEKECLKRRKVCIQVILSLSNSLNSADKVIKQQGALNC